MQRSMGRRWIHLVRHARRSQETACAGRGQQFDGDVIPPLDSGEKFPVQTRVHRPQNHWPLRSLPVSGATGIQ